MTIEDYFNTCEKYPTKQEINLAKAFFKPWTIFKYLEKEGRLADYGKALKDAYTDENGDLTAVDYFERYYTENGCPLLVTPNDIMMYSYLPDKVTLYRGCSMQEYESKSYGISWSPNLELAKSFAWGNYTYKGVVLRAKIKKKNCLAFFDSGQEVIVNFNRKHGFFKTTPILLERVRQIPDIMAKKIFAIRKNELDNIYKLIIRYANEQGFIDAPQ